MPYRLAFGDIKGRLDHTFHRVYMLDCTESLFQPAQESHPLSQASAPTMHTVPVAESQRDVGLVEAWVEGWKGGILVAPWEGGGLRLG